MHVTASALYDHISCSHRVSLDTWGDPSKRDPVSAFVRKLWSRGSAFEQSVIDCLPEAAVARILRDGGQVRIVFMDPDSELAQTKTALLGKDYKSAVRISSTCSRSCCMSSRSRSRAVSSTSSSPRTI